MRNLALADDYIHRAEKRIHALVALIGVEAWADVVRQAQECIELALKALLRTSRVEVPRIHDVSDLLDAHRDRLPEGVREHVDAFCAISRRLRRDRELAFYGTEDLTPSEFYKRADAESALRDARFVVETVRPCIPSYRP